MSKRQTSHAGSWYDDDGKVLSRQLDEWLGQVDKSIDGIGPIPQEGARVIIAPHAGYAYSGPAAAWAYKSLDVSKAKKLFLLGPSHHLYLDGCALSKHIYYSTPMGDLPLDEETIAELRATGDFQDLTSSQDAAEHSLEMHLPYIYKILSKSFKTGGFPTLVPIMVGSTSKGDEEHYGALLAPYLADPSNLFVVSSDFCHWGSRFSYTYYMPSGTSNPSDGVSLKKGDSPSDPPIHESIGHVDKLAMDAIASGSHDKFLTNLKKTKNTVCGRHPIGVIMAAIEDLKKSGKVPKEKGNFKFVKYERSSEVEEARDSSVSYASAFAVL